ncbi:cupin domain-containing protein [Algibacillus agarilyticus]|uniref:cupin domain-containing protein n=1 Tax=Algibacillus agarilyticus TaxID=2234133 RepID=UPI000DD0E249|nr:cupin domain-containing protein [Algibacillus agarilyticus]
MNADSLIQTLALEPHPEGGFYKEVYRAEGVIVQSALPACFSGDRHYATSIYFLLKAGQRSCFHKINQDEAWHFYAGSTLAVHMISPQGQYSVIKLGQNLAQGEVFQAVVPAGYYFAAQLFDLEASAEQFALVGCTVSPGFDFADFSMPNQQELLAEFPQHKALIQRLGYNTPH